MNDILVLAIDAARARFLALERPEFPEWEPGPTLVEGETLINAEREAAGRQLWSETKTGRNRGPGAGPAHAYDDHRENHAEEFERRFARLAAQEAAHRADRCQARQVVLVAERRMLGFVREALAPLLGAQVRLEELAKDLCKLRAAELQAHLAGENLLPAHRRP
ncbi:host attachment protein [Gloeobacter violaceus]|uniref:Gll1070 protein n=1 Tax=Gloeobacter violaceus (strain ATCC 29082 / PCC 7421) TaxID=251221 RepID=Q7NLQ1_GLOVI|nr:host attachment protein [Gloeobacter violaceus]BAC89011.1 gll1070 [Gloeobacter violaceus PCC 7421]